MGMESFNAACPVALRNEDTAEFSHLRKGDPPMKRLTALLIVLIVVVAPVGAQVGSGSTELSLSFAGGWWKMQNERAGSPTSETESLGYTMIALRLGVYVSDFLEVEPECMMTARESYRPAYAVAGNLLLLFPMTEERKASPFILAGYGISNGIPFGYQLQGRFSPEMDVNLLQAGGGVKIFASNTIAFRLEYRYQQYTREEEGWYGKEKRTYLFHNFFFGTSVFFNKQ